MIDITDISCDLYYENFEHMKNKDQILTEILFTEGTETITSNELPQDHDFYNKLMQVNLIRENFDIDYETGYFNDNDN